MYDYYCKNCKHIIGEWCINNNKISNYNILDYCLFTDSENFKSISFIDCIYCENFVGIVCFNVCKTCFGKDEIVEEKKIFNWFQKYKIIVNDYDCDPCEICDTDDFRAQPWFFKELSFYK